MAGSGMRTLGIHGRVVRSAGWVRVALCPALWVCLSSVTFGQDAERGSSGNFNGRARRPHLESVHSAPLNDVALQADFVVRELLSVDPDGTEHWSNPLDLNQPIEKGLRVMLDGSPTLGDAAYYFWDFGDGTYGSDATQPYDFHTFSQQRTVTLTAYSADWTEWDTVSKTIAVQGMYSLSYCPDPGVTFCPSSVALSGTELWALSGSYIGVVSLADPSHLPAVQVFQKTGMTNARQIALGAGKLAVAKCADGVDIFQASRTSFNLLGHLTCSQLGGTSAFGVGAVGNVLYVLTTGPDHVATYDMSNPAQPTLLNTLAIQGGVADFRQMLQAALILRNYPNLTHTVVDIRDPYHPSVAFVLNLQTSFSDAFEVVEDRIAARTTEGLAVWKVNLPQNPAVALSAGPKLIISANRFPIGFTDDRMYVASDSGVRKYDTADSAAPPYLMDAMGTAVNPALAGFLYYPAGSNGPVVIKCAAGLGYQSLHP